MVDSGVGSQKAEGKEEKEGGTTCCVPDPMNLLSNTVSFNLHKLIRLVMLVYKQKHRASRGG